MGGPPLSNRNIVGGSQLYQVGGQGSYRNMKNRVRGIGQSVISNDAQGYSHGHGHGGSGPYSLDRNSDLQASLNAMQI